MVTTSDLWCYLSEDDVEVVNPLPECPDDPECREPTEAEMEAMMAEYEVTEPEHYEPPYRPPTLQVLSVVGPVAILLGLIVVVVLELTAWVALVWWL